jgi:hypothetical protein
MLDFFVCFPTFCELNFSFDSRIKLCLILGGGGEGGPIPGLDPGYRSAKVPVKNPILHEVPDLVNQNL